MPQTLQASPTTYCRLRQCRKVYLLVHCESNPAACHNDKYKWVALRENHRRHRLISRAVLGRALLHCQPVLLRCQLWAASIGGEYLSTIKQIIFHWQCSSRKCRDNSCRAKPCY